MTGYVQLDGRPTDVYWIYDAEDRLLYIGCTTNLEQRLTDHQKQKEWFGRAARVETESFDTRPVAIEREWQAIWDDKPLFNKRVRAPKPLLPPIVKRDRLASVTQLLADEDA